MYNPQVMPAAFLAAPAHPDEHLLDLYALGRLDSSEEARIREHLMICDDCCLHLCNTTEFIAALRARFKQPGGA